MYEKAVKILLSTMKKSQKADSSDWWENYMNYISQEDFEFAKAQHVMFEPEQIAHDDIFKRINKAIHAINKENVVHAFIYSLSTRDLKYRSFLSSYCIGRVAPEHSFMASPKPNEDICAVCGLHKFEFEEPVDFNTTNYFKHADGSCFTDAIAVLFDLEQFNQMPIVMPTDEDYSILHQIKAVIAGAEPNDRIPQLKKKIQSCLKANDTERTGLLEILGVCNVLHDDAHFGYLHSYIPYPEREQRPIRFDDIDYPARWWQGKFGVDEQSWAYWFGNAISSDN